MTIVGLAMPGLSALVHEERLSLREMMDVDSLRLKRRGVEKSQLKITNLPILLQ